jgi:hypothetical protein
MPSTDPKPELTAKASMAQPVSQPAVYANGLINAGKLHHFLIYILSFFLRLTTFGLFVSICMSSSRSSYGKIFLFAIFLLYAPPPFFWNTKSGFDVFEYCRISNENVTGHYDSSLSCILLNDWHILSVLDIYCQTRIG